MSEPLNIDQIRSRLARASGKEYWRSLEEAAQTKEFHAFLSWEFPSQASEWPESTSRRDFLKLMAASLAFAGIAGCGSAPAEKIVPYVVPPEQSVPGKPQYFATAMTLGGYANGILVETHMGRPVKVEGNPSHPVSRGATDAITQASILNLWDPDRAKTMMNRGVISTLNSFVGEIGKVFTKQKEMRGRGLRILTERITSPTLASQIFVLLKEMPEAHWHQFEPLTHDAAFEGARTAFGEYFNTVYNFEKADVILSLDSNFLSDHPASVLYSRQFSSRRRVRDGEKQMNRFYAVGTGGTITDAIADHRLLVQPGLVESFARELAQAINVQDVKKAASPSGVPEKWLRAIADDLNQHRGRCVIIPGEQQPAVVHAIAHAMNEVLGNSGSTVTFTKPVEANPVNEIYSLRELVDAMNAGSVELLFIIGGNPAYSAPADIPFTAALGKVPHSVCLSQYPSETTAACEWLVPMAHEYESWSDARAHDGTLTIIQPVITPLYGGRSAHEFIALVRGETTASSYQIVRDYWKSQHGENFESIWRDTLRKGVLENSAFAAEKPTLRNDFDNTPPKTATHDPEIVFRPDPGVWDGRFVNNAWLQEFPKPITSLVWDNAAQISPKLAERLQLQNEDVIELRVQGRSLRLPALIVPGIADNTVVVTLGYGLRTTGRIGRGVGFNTYNLRTSEAMGFAPKLSIAKTDEVYRLARTQVHHSIEGRDLVRETTQASLNKKEHQELPHPIETSYTLYPEYEYKGYAWGMVIDLSACTGCGACVLACQSENNIPVVGKDQVLNSREMHWLRVDHYHSSEIDNPKSSFQPVPCMHCEKAPCEVVCPVHATTHSAEGINEMTYNRCIGTRYCSNNCPYKVRRFNFLDYSKQETHPEIQHRANPDVTIRERGVMEKCTYCIQRINHARIDAEKEDRRIREGELMTACQQVCPAEAIVFGDIKRPEAPVHKYRNGPLNYGLLAELGTQPRTTYLTKVTNPNPALEGNA